MKNLNFLAGFKSTVVMGKSMTQTTQSWTSRSKLGKMNMETVPINFKQTIIGNDEVHMPQITLHR